MLYTNGHGSLKKSKGITLIALVITIIVLIILAGVVLLALSGDNGIIKRASDSIEETKEANIIEQIRLEQFEGVMENDGDNESKILWDSPFNYQLIGSIEQEKIEKKIGRKLEATDLFYEVDLSQTQYKDEKYTYIYNKKEDILVKVDKRELKRSNGVWYWTEETKPEIYQYFIDETKRIEMLDFLKSEGITEVYVSFGEENLEDPTITKQFVKQAYERGIITEYLVGDARYILEENQKECSYDKIQLILNYNKNCNYDEKIRGIHYDVEIHTSQTLQDLKDWNNSNSEEEKNSNRKISFVKFVENVYEVKGKNNITIAFDVPPLTYTANTVNYNGTEKSIMEYIVENSDYISCMAYKNDYIKLFRYICLPSNTEYAQETGRIAYTSNTKVFSDGTLRNPDIVHELALKHRKNIMVGVNVGETGEKDTFYDLGKNEMKNVINKFGELMQKSSSDVVVGSRSLKQQATEKCGYTNIDFDHYGFIFHESVEYFNMPQ